MSPRPTHLCATKSAAHQQRQRRRRDRTGSDPCAASLALLPFLALCLLMALVAVPLSTRAAAVRYRGSVYSGLTNELLQAGGATLTVRVPVSAFPTDEAELANIATRIISSSVHVIDDDGVVLNSTTGFMQATSSLGELAAGGSADLLLQWQRATRAIVSRGTVTAADSRHEVVFTFPPLRWQLPPHFGVMVVPCVPFELFDKMGAVGVLDMPDHCIPGDPFLIRERPFVRLDAARWVHGAGGSILVTGNPLEVPLSSPASGVIDKFMIERDLRVVEGSTCLQTRNAFVRGSVWDMRRRVYRYVPNRGGLQTLCHSPFPEMLPLLRVKVAGPYQVSGPEGVSTDPPQVRVGMEFVGTVYGTNLTERDTAVITDEQCNDLTTQNVFFVELFFSSSSRASFFGTFHKRGIYHVCYHRDGASSYVRVATVLVEKSAEITIDGDSANVLVDQDVKLLESTAVMRMKVQDKGHLDLKQQSLSVSYFVWSGGIIGGNGTVNCTSFSKITTKGYETRQLSVALHNYGEMAIDVQRLLLDRDGVIHNYGNLTLAVSSMGFDGISSVLSMGKYNTINNHRGGTLRIVALDERSYALLTSRIVLWDGSLVVSGRVNVTDLSSGELASVVLKRGTQLTAYNTRLAGHLTVESRAVLTMMEACTLASTAVAGSGFLRLLGEGILVDSVNVTGSVSTFIGRPLPGSATTEPVLAMTLSGTHVFGPQTHVDVQSVGFTTASGVTKAIYHGSLVAAMGVIHYGSSIIIQVGGTAVFYGDPLDRGALWHRRRHAPFQPQLAGYSSSTDDLASESLTAAGPGPQHDGRPSITLFVPPSGTLYVVDTVGLGAGSDTDTDTGTAAEAQSARCETFNLLTDFLIVSGRMALRGCGGISLGGQISGSVETLTSAEDWEKVVSVACKARGTGVGPDAGPFLEAMSAPRAAFCRGGAVPPAHSHGGLAIGHEVYVRSPGRISLNEFSLASGVMRSADHLVLTAADIVIIHDGATLMLRAGATIAARHLRVEGTLDIAEPHATHITGNVSVGDTGVVSLHGIPSPCHGGLHVSGYLSLPRQESLRCLKASPLERVSPGDLYFTLSPRDGEELRRQALGGLPYDVSCPEHVLRMVAEKQSVFFSFLSGDDLRLPAGVPSRRGIITGTIFAIVTTAAVFATLLWLSNSSLSDYYKDFRAVPDLKLTLTWYEFSYSAMNYVLFVGYVAATFQSTTSAFHPKLPAPLVSVSMMCLHTIRLLTPHICFSPKVINTFSLAMLMWPAFHLALFGGQLRLHRKRSGRRRYVFAVFLRIESIWALVMAIMRAPMLSLLLDGAACTFVYPELSSCAPFQTPFTVILSLTAFFSMSVMGIWSFAANQMLLSSMDLRVKMAFNFAVFMLGVFDVCMWKVLFSSPRAHLICSGSVQVARFLVHRYAPPTAYENVNRILSACCVVPIAVTALFLLQTFRADLGWISTCTDGDAMFRALFVLCLVGLAATFWRNMLQVRGPEFSSGNPYVDALQRSVQQIRTRIHDLKADVFAATDTIERDNTLNAIARLRIEYLEKQERYRQETHHLMRRFYLGCRLDERDQALSRLPISHRYGFDELGILGQPLAASPTLSGTPYQDQLSDEEMESFSCGPALGKGSYGTVHLGILANGKLVAVKYVNVARNNSEAFRNVMSEINMLRELSHPNVISYYGAHQIDELMLVFMEFAVGGSLTSIVRKFTGLTETVMQLYTYQILLGLCYLHSKGVVHRDIKGENILIDGYGVVKLSDFGCSKSLANIAAGGQASCGTLVGSPFWMAPEVIRSENYGTRADIWSVGCTVVEMLNGGDPPWSEEFDNVYSAMFYVGSTNGIPQIPEDTSEECLDFLHRCFERDVAKRATADELLEHPWLAAAAQQTRDGPGGPWSSGIHSPALGACHLSLAVRGSVTSPRHIVDTTSESFPSPSSPVSPISAVRQAGDRFSSWEAKKHS